MGRECLNLLSFAKLQSTTFPASGRPAWKSSNSTCGTLGHAPTPGISCALGSKLPPHRPKFYRFWDNVTWLEWDPFISGPRTVNLCKFWHDLALNVNPQIEKTHTQSRFATSSRILEAICWGYDIRTSLWDMGVVKLPVTLLHVPCCNQWNIKFWWVPVISLVLVSN